MNSSRSVPADLFLTFLTMKGGRGEHLVTESVFLLQESVQLGSHNSLTPVAVWGSDVGGGEGEAGGVEGPKMLANMCPSSPPSPFPSPLSSLPFSKAIKTCFKK